MGRFVPDIILAIMTGGAGKAAQSTTAVGRLPRRAISGPRTMRSTKESGEPRACSTT